jgi:hypothetical protein
VKLPLFCVTRERKQGKSAKDVEEYQNKFKFILWEGENFIFVAKPTTCKARIFFHLRIFKNYTTLKWIKNNNFEFLQTDCQPWYFYQRWKQARGFAQHGCFILFETIRFQG